MRPVRDESSLSSFLCCLLSMLLLVLSCGPAYGAPVAVHFTEGMARGFLELNDSAGQRLAAGDFLQIPNEGEMKTRVVLYFRDGSLHDETVVFSQQHKFLLKSYRLIQKGKAFENDLDVTLERATGKYRVKVKGKDGHEKLLEGELELPPDVYNGMLPTVMKNLTRGSRETIHMIAFTPTPRVVELEMAPAGSTKIQIGDVEKTAVHYVLKPHLGLLRLPAALLGKSPPDSHIWTVMDEVPAFVKFEGPLATGGPVWRIELTSPRWPK
ncbi:hypothetical protein [Geomonas diazotrophica]|nr:MULTISPECIES: hypothetical protein [Geomonas]